MPITTTLVPPNREEEGEDEFSDKAYQWSLDILTWTVEANELEANVNAKEELAEAWALTAVNAPGTSATSTTSNDIGTGVKNFTIQTGKALVATMFVLIARTSAPGNWMHGQIVSYDSGTGALVVSVAKTNGAGTGVTDWTITLSRPIDFIAATAAEIWAGTANDRAVTPAGQRAALASVGVADGANITLNFANGLHFHLTTAMVANRTIKNPTGLAAVIGETISFKIPPGGFTPSFESYWDFGAVIPTFSGDPAKADIVVGYVRSATKIEARLSKGFGL